MSSPSAWAFPFSALLRIRIGFCIAHGGQTFDAAMACQRNHFIDFCLKRKHQIRQIYLSHIGAVQSRTFIGPRPIALMDYVITLVHGTFARKAAWIREESTFRKYLSDNLLSANILFLPFTWSGGNSVSARHEAAQQLRSSLTATVALHPEARHFVIGHSHGGSVALYAVSGSPLENDIDGLICLSTPFLHIRERSTKDYFGPIVLIDILVLSLYGSIFGITHIPGFHALGFGATMAVLLIPEILIGIGWNSLRNRWPYRAKLISSLMTIPKRINTRIMIVRATADEASAVLISAQFATWLLRKAFSISWLPYKSADAWAHKNKIVIWTRNVSNYIIPLLQRHSHRLTLYTIITFIFGGSLVALASFFPREFGDSVMGTGAVIAACSLIWFFAYTIILILWMPAAVALLGLTIPGILLAVPLWFLSFVAFLPFGWDLAASTLWYEVSSESTPPLDGQWPVEIIKTSSDGDDNLRHSVVYDDREAALLIACWISG